MMQKKYISQDFFKSNVLSPKPQPLDGDLTINMFYFAPCLLKLTMKIQKTFIQLEFKQLHTVTQWECVLIHFNHLEYHNSKILH